MNWARAKTIMICAFLMLNIFLGYQLMHYEDVFNRQSNRSEANAVASTVFSSQMNISLAFDLPLDAPSVDILEVERMPLLGGELAELLWTDKAYQYDADNETYYCDYQSLIQVNPYKVHYLDTQFENNTRCLDDEMIEKHLPRAMHDRQYLAISEPLLKFELKRLLGFDFSDSYLDHIEFITKEDGQKYYKLFFVQKFIYPIYDRHSYITVLIDEHGVIRDLECELVGQKTAQKNLLEGIKAIKGEILPEQKSSILSAAEAMFIYLGTRTFKPEDQAIIQNVNLAYYGYDIEDLSNPSETLVSWDIIPVWCLNLKYQDDEGTETSEKIYLNAFTGREEKHLFSGIK